MLKLDIKTGEFIEIGEVQKKTLDIPDGVSLFLKGDKGDKGDPGEPGKDGLDGKSILGQKGDKGDTGRDAIGSPGKDGIGIEGINQPLPGKLEIKFTNGGSRFLDLPAGKNGREVELMASDTHIRWRYNAETEWRDLFAIPKPSLGGGGGVYKLKSLFDVSLSSPANAQILSYNSTTKKWENSAGNFLTETAADLLYIQRDGGTTTTGTIPFAAGITVPALEKFAFGGTYATPNLAIYNDGADSYIQGVTQNGGHINITANPNVADAVGGSVFIFGATGIGEVPVTSGSTYIGQIPVSKPTSLSALDADNFLGVGGELTVVGQAGFNSKVYVGTHVATSLGAYNLNFNGQAAQSMGVTRAQSAVSAGQAFGINAGGAKSATTNQNGGSLTLSSGTATGTGTGSVVIQATGGGSSGTADKVASTVATFSIGAVTLADAYNITVNTTTGTKIGTATTGKLGFWNATPIIQPVNSTAIDTLLTNTGFRASGGFSNFATKLGIPSLAASSTEGDFWSDSTQKSLATFTDGIKQMLAGCLFTQTADKSVTNTLTETSIVGTGVGGLTLPANFFVAGKTIRITMSGVYSTVAVTGDIVTIKVKHGTTVLATKATSALVTGATDLFWESEILVTCRTAGAGGTVQVSGGVRYQIAGSVIVEDELNNGAATTALNTTASGLLDVTVTHGTANASNTVKSLVSSFEILN